MTTNEKKEDGNEDVIELEDGTSIMKNQNCPYCSTKNLSLIESERDIPFFGKTFFFSMECSNCDYFHADLECETKREPAKYKLKVESPDDLTIRVVRSASATIKIPRIITITPSSASNGYVTNIEGIINRVEHMLQEQYDTEDDKSKKKKLKNMLKKLRKVKSGHDTLDIVLEDKTGNSAIISPKAIKSKL